jgi:hypothetical protein
VIFRCVSNVGDKIRHSSKSPAGSFIIVGDVKGLSVAKPLKLDKVVAKQPACSELPLLQNSILCSIRISSGRPLSLALALLSSCSIRTLTQLLESLLALTLEISDLIVVLIECFTSLFQLALHPQEFLDTAEFIRVAPQCKTEIVDLDLLATGVAGILGCIVAHLKDKVGDDFIENTDSLRKGLRWERWMRTGVSVCQKEKTH